MTKIGAPTKERVLELARQELTAAEIARETGLRPTQVAGICQRAGVRTGPAPRGANWNGEIGPRGIDYDAIHGMANTIGCSIDKLIALSPSNDPFFAGVAYRVKAARWFADVVWAKYGAPSSMNIRRLHYLLLSTATIVTPDGTPYENTVKCVNALCSASLAARYLGLVPFDALTDERNDKPIIFADHLYTDPNVVQELKVGVRKEIGIDDVIAPEMPDVPSFTLSYLDAIQKFIVEVWIEKSTQNDWLIPLCKRRGVNPVVGGGEQSEIRCRELALRAAKYAKPVRILYLSDLDPGGRSMPKAVARKIEFTVAKFGLNVDIQLIPIGLTPEQCRQYSLPRIPLKDSEKRKAKFQKTFGEGATELDAMEALHPGEMARILGAEIDKYLDTRLPRRVSDLRLDWEIRLNRIQRQVHDQHRGEIEELVTSFKEIIASIDDIHQELGGWQDDAEDVWNQIAQELEAKIPDLSDVAVPRSEATGETDQFRLYDSSRDYLSQMDIYNRWRDGDEAEASE